MTRPDTLFYEDKQLATAFAFALCLGAREVRGLGVVATIPGLPDKNNHAADKSQVLKAEKSASLQAGHKQVGQIPSQHGHER